MKKIYSFELYNKRTGKNFVEFLRDYLGLKEEKCSLDVILPGFLELRSIVDSHLEDTIAIAGDYDVDGISASTIMKKALEAYGVKRVEALIPNRFSDGYGLNPSIVDRAITLGAKLIITVDNGIVAFEATKYAKSKGIDIIITDHHLHQDNLPCADLVISPHIGENELENRNICGAMVAFLIAKYLLHESNEELEEIACLATIADVMPLKGENRLLVKQTIERIRKNKGMRNPGLSLLTKAIGVHYEQFNTESFSFSVAPILNTPGRLTSADLSLELLISNDYAYLDGLVKQMLELNIKRKKILDELKLAINDQIKIEEPANIVVLDDANEGLIGVLAGMLSNRDDKPSFVFVKAHDGYKASGRSPKWCDLSVVAFKALEGIEPLACGGHANAMGLTLKSLDDVNKFKDSFNTITSNLERADELETYLRLPAIPNNLICDALDELAPYGEGLKEPLFAITTKILSPIYLSGKHTKLNLYINGEGLEALWFFHIFKPEDIYYNIYFKLVREYNSYHRRIEIKMMIDSIEPFEH